MDTTEMDLDLELDAELEAELIADLETGTTNSNDTNTTTTTTTTKIDVKPDAGTMLVSDEHADRFEALPRRTAIFLYGVDEMSTADITKYTDSPLLIKVEWINDSSCNLAFKTEQDALQVAQKLLDQPVSELDHRTLVAAKPFENHALSIRIATDEDIKERGARERSRYYLLHGVGDQSLNEPRKEARKAHLERMQRNGGDGRDVFSRLGAKVERHNERRSNKRDRSRSPSRSNGSRSIKRERSVEREIPQHLKSRLGLAKTEHTAVADQHEEKDRKEPEVKDEVL